MELERAIVVAHLVKHVLNKRVTSWGEENLRKGQLTAVIIDPGIDKMRQTL